MIVEVFVGKAGAVFAAWSPMFPSVVCWSPDIDTAFQCAVTACKEILRSKRHRDSALPDPDLLEWLPRTSQVPYYLQAAYEDALGRIGKSMMAAQSTTA